MVKKAATIVGVILIALVGLGLYLQVGKSIPDHAQIDVFPSHRYWLPHARFVSDRLNHDLSNPDKTLATVKLMEEITPATWGDVEDGKYKGFVLPPGWATYTDNYTTERNTPLLVHLIFRPKGRWNPDGTWNY